jgi:chromosome segregation ATPase
VITFLRERLSTKSAELDKTQKRVSELEQLVLRVDQSIEKTSKVSDVQSVHIDKLAQTTKQSLALADTLLAHGLKLDQLSSELFQARASGELAKRALLDTEDNLVELKAELAGLKEQTKAADARVVEEEDKVAQGLAREQALEQE